MSVTHVDAIKMIKKRSSKTKYNTKRVSRGQLKIGPQRRQNSDHTNRAGADITTPHDCIVEEGRGFFIKLNCGSIHNLNQRK